MHGNLTTANYQWMQFQIMVLSYHKKKQRKSPVVMDMFTRFDHAGYGQNG
jgi:hypothetical protein